MTTLTLTEKLTCPKSKRASAAAKKKKSRKLWGDGSGSFRTRVRKGVVTVNDFVKHRTVIVRAGKRYTARAKRR